ncbi:MAG: family 1 glycosylhydrolase, partial [Candidatus Thermoplasmatota archaeon]|nr:family 1 glycosylhydrolase [Candidatus Thermoplasmatota archaeon]
MEWQVVVGYAIIVYLTIILIFHLFYPEKHLDWQSINLDEMTFPQDFTWGVATASHQIEGGNSNNWTQFEERENKERSGDACDHWNLWNKDHDLLNELGVSSYRFSIEWSRIEPNEGEWNEAAIQVYSDMIDSLIAKGIEPMVTLH